MEVDKKETDREHLLRFPKSERLCSPILQARLFGKGSSHYSYPLRMTWLTIDASSLPEQLRTGSLMVMVNAPKKRFKRAVDRVRLRRLMRESWRLNRVLLRERFTAARPGQILLVGVVYVGSELAPFAKVNSKMEKLIAHLSMQLFPETDPASEDNA